MSKFDKSILASNFSNFNKTILTKNSNLLSSSLTLFYELIKELQNFTSENLEQILDLMSSSSKVLIEIEDDETKLNRFSMIDTIQQIFKLVVPKLSKEEVKMMISCFPILFETIYQAEINFI